MQRRNREINIFNMSALDLFASALGAFILLFVILMPYYLKTSKSVMQENAQLKTEISVCQAQVVDLKKQVDNLRQKLTECEQQKQQLQTENSQLKQQIQKMKKDLQQAQKSLEDRVKFALLGINTTAKSFVLVIDMSGSMDAYTKIMTETVARILLPFEGKHSVQIFGFNENGFDNWQTPYSLLGMTDVNKKAANKFADILSTRFGGGTPTRKALLEALKYDAEAIILLTDGNPDTNPDDIIQVVTAKNSGKKEIHTVAIGEYNAKPGLAEFLQQLAKKNRGAFVGVAK